MYHTLEMVRQFYGSSDHRTNFFPFQGIGAVALVHDNTQIPLIESAGIFLSPGKEHRLSYRKKIISLLPPPYTSCMNELSPSMEIMLENYANADYGYTAHVCYDFCQQAYM